MLQSTAPKGVFSGNKVGLEKESLRVAPSGSLAQTPHPVALGSALTHPFITTDYSEALLEFVTPAFNEKQDVLDFLTECQTFVYQQLQDEILWSTSMPCVLAGETSIPIAKYGTSNLGQMKTVYRRGLGHRYGRVMQVIAGVHYNYSFSPAFWELFKDLEKSTLSLQHFISENYFNIIRNVQRVGWLIPYLFGASPAVCKSFLHGQTTDMPSFNENTYYYPYATSLRMGDIGYQNNIENASGIRINYDNLSSYIKSLAYAISTPYDPYKKIGIKTEKGYEQLSANLLQIENEYYSSIRPKQIGPADEMPINGLKRRGVAYIELRSLDINAYEPTGISCNALYFLETLMLYCLLQPSPPISVEEHKNISRNLVEVAHRGRQPGLMLQSHDSEQSLLEWARKIFKDLSHIAEFLDANSGCENFSRALQLYRIRIENPDDTPSARMLAEMKANGEGFFHFALRKSEEHSRYFNSLTLSPERWNYFQSLSTQSLEKQKLLETSNKIGFDNFLENYFSQNLKAFSETN